MKLSSVQLAEFINHIPDAYYYEDTSEELWETILESKGPLWHARDRTQIVDASKHLSGGYFVCNDKRVDPLSLHDKPVLPVLKKWLADQTSQIRSFRIPNDKAEQVLSYLESIGIAPL